MISPSDYVKHDAVGLAKLVRKGEVSPAELTSAAMDLFIPREHAQ